MPRNCRACGVMGFSTSSLQKSGPIPRRAPVERTRGWRRYRWGAGASGVRRHCQRDALDVECDGGNDHIVHSELEISRSSALASGNGAEDMRDPGDISSEEFGSNFVLPDAASLEGEGDHSTVVVGWQESAE